MATELSAALLQFIRECVPTYQAAEVLLFLAANSDRDFSAEEIVVAMRPSAITYLAVREYTALFAESGLISETHGRFKCQPATGELEEALGALAHAYNERPVTLIRTIYRIADSKIQAFSDSFKLRED